MIHSQFALWIWTSINMHDFLNTTPVPVHDWTSPGYGRTYALTFFWNLEGLAFQSFLYWIVGTRTSPRLGV